MRRGKVVKYTAYPALCADAILVLVMFLRTPSLELVRQDTYLDPARSAPGDPDVSFKIRGLTLPEG